MQLSIIEQRRVAILERMTETGAYDPECKTCQQHIGNHENPANAFYPRHRPRCGAHYAHCTCDSCF